MRKFHHALSSLFSCLALLPDDRLISLSEAFGVMSFSLMTRSPSELIVIFNLLSPGSIPFASSHHFGTYAAVGWLPAETFINFVQFIYSLSINNILFKSSATPRYIIIYSALSRANSVFFMDFLILFDNNKLIGQIYYANGRKY